MLLRINSSELINETMNISDLSVLGKSQSFPNRGMDYQDLIQKKDELEIKRLNTMTG